MPKTKKPNIRLKVRTEDGAILESSSDVTEAKAFAIYIFNWLYDVPQSDPPSEFLSAVAVFRDACEKHRKASGM